MISIITATYNRAYIIEGLYKSLCRQTLKDFEWIVVDDGSTDNSFELLSKWKSTCSGFQIKLYRQQNGGKHRAVNKGIQEASGKYCFIVDSDDILADDAVETILTWWSHCEHIENIAAVSGLKGRITDHSRIGEFPMMKEGHVYIEAKNTERRRFHLLGDKAEVYRSILLKANPFRSYDGENFMSESTVWDELAYQGYTVRWYNKIIYYCEYLADGLTKRGDEKEIKNFRGFTYYTKQRIKCYNIIEGIIARGYYYSIAQKKGLTLFESARNIDSNGLFLYLCFVAWKCKNIILSVKKESVK